MKRGVGDVAQAPARYDAAASVDRALLRRNVDAHHDADEHGVVLSAARHEDDRANGIRRRAGLEALLGLDCVDFGIFTGCAHGNRGPPSSAAGFVGGQLDDDLGRRAARLERDANEAREPARGPLSANVRETSAPS